MGFKKADDFYIALGGAKISPKVVVNKVMQRLKQGEAADGEPTAADLLSTRRKRRRPESSSSQYGIRVEGVDDVMLRLAKCCRPVPGDPIVGYISLGRGITIHREDCPNARRAAQGPRALHAGRLGRRGHDVLQGRAPGRRLGPPPPARGPLADVRRGRHQHPRGALHRVADQMVRNRFVVEVGDTQALNGAISRLRNIDGGLRRLPRDADGG